MDHEFERAPIAKPDCREVAHIARRESTDAQIFRKHHNRRINQAEAKYVVSPVDRHPARELIDRRRRVVTRRAREGRAAGDIRAE